MANRLFAMRVQASRLRLCWSGPDARVISIRVRRRAGWSFFVWRDMARKLLTVVLVKRCPYHRGCFAGACEAKIRRDPATRLTTPSRETVVFKPDQIPAHNASGVPGVGEFHCSAEWHIQYTAVRGTRPSCPAQRALDRSPAVDVAQQRSEQAAPPEEQRDRPLRVVEATRDRSFKSPYFGKQLINAGNRASAHNCSMFALLGSVGEISPPH